MNPPIASPTTSIAQPFQAIVEILANGQVAAWVAEFQDSKVIAVDRSRFPNGDATRTECSEQRYSPQNSL